MKDDEAYLRLTIDVHYELGGAPVRDLERVLRSAADHLEAEGLLSGETEASVLTCTSAVTPPNDQTLAEIRDLLFLDMDHNDEFYNFDKEQDPELWDEITNKVREHFAMKEVTCSLCGKSVWIEEAHLYENEYIGACCWDDRLKASE